MRNSRLIELYRLAFSTEDLQPRLALLQEGEQLSQDREEELFVFRLLIADTYFSLRKPEMGLVAFIWCLSAFDRNPDLGRNLEWILLMYNRVVCCLVRYYQIKLYQIDELLLDLRKRLLVNGFSESYYLWARSSVELYTGLPHRVDQSKARWIELKKDSLSADLGSETNYLVYCHAHMKRWKQVIETAQPFLNGKLVYDQSATHTIPIIAKAYYHLGDLEKARSLTDLGVIRTEGQLVHFGEVYELIENYALLNALTPGIDLLERRASWYREAPTPFHEYRYCAAATLFLNKVVAENSQLRLRLSPSYLEEMGLSDDRAETLLNCLSARAEKMGKSFDARNGNSYWTEFYEL